MSTPSLSFAGRLRLVIRQLAAAVYAYIAFAIAVWIFQPESLWTATALRLGLVFLASLILAAIQEGPLWGAGLVGLFAAGFELVLLSVGTPIGQVGETLASRMVWGPVAGLILAGWAGALLGRRRRGRTEAAPPA